jgi:hypothetical protein
VSLGPGASPYNYSDMTGFVAGRATSPQGIWTIVQNGGTPGVKWGTINWNTEPQGKEPAGSSIIVEVRTGDTEASLPGQPFVPVTNGGQFDQVGQFIEVRVTLKANSAGESPVLSDIRVKVTPQVVALVIDEESIKNGSKPNNFTSQQVNEDIKRIGQREQLRYFRDNVGKTITLWSGQVGDEGWFALKTIPDAWNKAGPTADGLRNYVLAGPGLGSGSDRERLLDKVPDVTPLRATGLKNLVGREVCAVVNVSDVSINYSPLNGSLKGDNRGTVAFRVKSVKPLTGQSSSSLPEVQVEILDAKQVCGGPLTLMTDAEAPKPKSSSEPFDIKP